MNALQFARDNIRFDETSPITGPFRDEKYPFLRGPLNASDDITVKRLVVYKSSSSMGSVLGELINTKRVRCDVGNQIMVCQTDEKADQWSKTRGKQWLTSIKDIERLIKKDKYAVTNSLWLFRHKWLSISGPGINNAQSDQCRYLQTDEAHLDAYGPGCLIEWEKRMGGRWDAQATHISTAADLGKEIDRFFHEGSQDEWHWRCPKCAKLVWPLWEEDARKEYNGQVVLYRRSTGEIVFYCPYCGHSLPDTARNRYDLVRDGDYVRKNDLAPISVRSFRWNVFAAHWINWRSMGDEFTAAQESAKLGDLKPLEDWEKKRLCKSWEPYIPDFGTTPRSTYGAGDIWAVNEDKLRVASFDFQEGHGPIGVHWWGQVDEFTRNGDSRRIDYRKLTSWGDCRGFQQDNRVADGDTFCDAGFRDKEVFARCADWKWYALISSDTDEFSHIVTIGGEKKRVTNPYYSQTNAQDSMAGKIIKQAKKGGLIVPHGSRLPIGWCYSRTWSKPNIGYLLLRIKDGRLGNEYGIGRDIIEEYTSQLNSYTEVIQVTKSTGRRQRLLKQVKEADHAFSTGSMCLVGAIIRGFFPVANSTEPKTA